MPDSRFVYVTYIRTTPEALWRALTDGDFMPQYWLGARMDAEWHVGGAWTLHLADGRVADEGTVEAFEPPTRLRLRWTNRLRPELTEEGEALCMMELEPKDAVVRLTVTHEIAREGSKLIEAVSGGWPQILSNLKSLLETGTVVLPQRFAA